MKTAITIRYKLKHGYRNTLMPELERILDLCAKESEFELAFLQESAERPDEIRIFELWKGTKEEFERVQAPKAYRQSYLARTKDMVISVEVEMNELTRKWQRE